MTTAMQRGVCQIATCRLARGTRGLFYAEGATKKWKEKAGKKLATISNLVERYDFTCLQEIRGHSGDMATLKARMPGTRIEGSFIKEGR